jgi:hypothetical protein
MATGAVGATHPLDISLVPATPDVETNQTSAAQRVGPQPGYTAALTSIAPPTPAAGIGPTAAATVFAEIDEEGFAVTRQTATSTSTGWQQ